MVSVLLIDEIKLIRQSVSAVLQMDKGIKVVGEGSDWITAINMNKKLKPDLIIMNFNTPDPEGIKAVQAIRKITKNVKILILTMLEDEEFIMNALSKEVDGYILKMARIEDLIYAVKSIADGRKYFDPKLTSIVYESRKYAEGNKTLLTVRELEILKLITQGITNNGIADKLFISPFTVKKHRKNILKKLHLHNTAGLVRFAIEHKLK